MRVICDLHLHSKYSRATSPKLDHEGIAKYAKLKGIDIVGTADFTHPIWLAQLKDNLEEAGEGLYRLKNNEEGALYLISGEISSIYSQGGKVRKIHNLILIPSFEVAQKVNEKLSKVGNIYADGRPIFGISSIELVKLLWETDPNIIVIPAHAWTPHFSVFGSQSGFDSLEECFGEFTDRIYTIETGLSSDPEMNWRLSALDNVSLVSFSDSHSPANLLREATVFELNKPSFFEIAQALKNPRPKKDDSAPKLLFTIEFYPEEGKYHFDGHRNCNVNFEPRESKEHKGICPVCHRPLTIGVMNRVEQLADRPEGFKPQNYVPFKRLVQLPKIIAQALGVGEASVRIEEEYQKIINQFGSEFAVLVDLPLSKLEKSLLPKIVEGIGRVREGNIAVVAGFDGEYGKIKIFEQEEKAQASLF